MSISMIQDTSGISNFADKELNLSPAPADTINTFLRKKSKKLSRPKNELIIHQLSDPYKFNPVSGEFGGPQLEYMYQSLLSVDQNTLELIPWLAKGVPVLERSLDCEETLITFEIKESATWDDGTSITPRDVEFSLMAVLNPKINTNDFYTKSYGSIVDFKYYPESPNKFSFVCTEVFAGWDYVTGRDLWIIPEKKYDREGQLSKLHFADYLALLKQKTLPDSIVDFAEHIKLKSSQNQILNYGSGPYKLIQYERNVKLVLERKKKWWGKDFKDENKYFQDGPDKVIFKTINNITDAMIAMKNNEIDIIESVRPNDWVHLEKSKAFKKNFVRSSPPYAMFSYIGLPVKNPLLSDKRTRQALAHLVDTKYINDNLLYGLSNRIIGPIHPTQTKSYHSEIVPYDYDPTKAKLLLKQAGWKDADNDGILEKEVNGEFVPFKISFTYNNGNEIRKAVGLYLKESYKEVGIEIEVLNSEWSVFLENLKGFKMELFYGAWVHDQRPSDPTQLWHTKSIYGGSNYCRFGNEESDALIEEIKSELNVERRDSLYHVWQELLHDESPYIFLYTTKRRNVIHKRFKNINESVVDPGYWGGGFQLN